MKEHIKMIHTPCLDKWSKILSGQLSQRSNSSHLFWNLKYLVLVQILPLRRKLTYQLLLIGFIHKLISGLDVGHNILYLHVV